MRGGGQRRVTRIAGGIALTGSLLGSGLLWAQSQPKFPVPMPAPKTEAAPATGAAPAAPVPASPEAPPSSNVPAGARDPFDPLVKKPNPGDERRLQEIAGLRLVGILWDPKSRDEIRALVETPDGLGYYLRANEERFGGRVVAIDRDRVQFQVREQIPGGQSRLRTIELRLPKPEGQ
jgi:hypothetical protein